MKRKRQALNGEEMKWSWREKRRKGVATKGSEMHSYGIAGQRKYGKSGAKALNGKATA